MDLRKLLVPLRAGDADVVLGSRFLSGGYHRVLYFWHSLGNKFLTLLSNMLTDLNLTDMETCYKVFRREVIQGITIEENRFGFEPEVVAKIAHLRLRIYEMGISYRGRTYAEGKKIGMKDGFRALYCILKYNLHKAPWIVQFVFYLGIGGASAIVNLLLFLALYRELGVTLAAPVAFFIGRLRQLLPLDQDPLPPQSAVEVFARDRHLSARRRASVSLVDLYSTQFFIAAGMNAALAKAFATAIGLVLNFARSTLHRLPGGPQPGLGTAGEVAAPTRSFRPASRTT